MFKILMHNTFEACFSIGALMVLLNIAQLKQIRVELTWHGYAAVPTSPNKQFDILLNNPSTNVYGVRAV